jgi:hypothetical protein
VCRDIVKYLFLVCRILLPLLAKDSCQGQANRAGSPAKLELIVMVGFVTAGLSVQTMTTCSVAYLVKSRTITSPVRPHATPSDGIQCRLYGSNLSQSQSARSAVTECSSKFLPHQMKEK